MCLPYRIESIDPLLGMVTLESVEDAATLSANVEQQRKDADTQLKEHGVNIVTELSKYTQAHILGTLPE